MLSKFISLGNKIELQEVEHKPGAEGERPKIYYSKVYEILSEDLLEIVMPMEKTKLVLLQVDNEYDLVFYGESGLFQCFARVVDRYKSNNVYLLRMELTSNLRKYQRREYYRFSCALEMHARGLEEEEVLEVENKPAYILQRGLPLRRSVIVDISGGGLRFLSSQKYDEGSLIYCNYHLVKDGVSKTYDVVGRVLAARELENRPGTFEHRVQYYNMSRDVREEIIKFIFEEERKSRRKDKMS
ncbi:MAG: flagellar brake protein [Clostridium sp.]|nr:flagellar brake protein [Acetatifactor muris]MCM1562245.1 flagellar brake protein [Clostridium sp.]